jgi:hypothetical protein
MLLKSEFASEDHMKRLAVVGGICASFLLGAAITAVAQDEHRNDKNDKQENAHPENRQEQAQPQQQARPQEQPRPDDRRNQQPQSGDRHEMTPQSEGRQEPQSGDRHPQKPENDRQVQQQQERQNREMQQGREQERHEQAQPRQGEQSRAEGRGGNHRRIPDSDFNAHFGREHHFRPGRVQVYGGRPQFNYSGYVFELVEPWPTGWAYDDDDYYIDYVDDEYWLYSLRYPGVRLEVFIIQ